MADKFNLDGFSVSDADVCTADGGFVGDITGTIVGSYNEYVASGAIAPTDNQALLADSASAMTLANEGVDGQRLVIRSTITSQLTSGFITIDFTSGEWSELGVFNNSWAVIGGTATVA